MHEFAICRNLVDLVVAELEGLPPPRPRLTGTRVVVGRLRQIVPDQLRWAYDVMVEDTIAAGSALTVIEAPLTGVCNACGWEGEVALRTIACAACGSRDVTVPGGRELYIEALEVEQDGSDP